MKLHFRSLLKAVLLSAMTLMAGTAMAGVDYLIVNLVDGSNASFALADDPKVSVADNQLTVETSTQIITVAFDDLENYKFYDSSAGVDKISTPNHYQMENGIIAFEGLKAGETVAVYNVAGVLVLQTTATADGCASVDTSVLPTGVYVVRTASSSIKISNK